MSIKNKSKNIDFKSVLLSFAAFIFLLIAFALYLFLYTAGNDNFLMSKLTRSGYGELIRYELETEINGISLSSGIPSTVLIKTFEGRNITHDYDGFYKNAFKGQSFAINIFDIQTQLRSDIDAYFETITAALPEDKDEVRDATIKECTDKYIDIVKMESVEKVYLPFAKYKKLYPILVVLSAVISLLFFYLIWRTNTWKHRSMRYYICILLSVALSLLTGPVIMLITDLPSKLNIASAAVHSFVSTSAISILWAFIWVSIVTAILTIAVGYPVYSNYKRKSYKR